MNTPYHKSDLTIDKAKLYKTAYSSLYDQYVEIFKVRDNQGLIIFDCLLEGNYMMFSQYELTDFCL